MLDIVAIRQSLLDADYELVDAFYYKNHLYTPRYDTWINTADPESIKSYLENNSTPIDSWSELMQCIKNEDFLKQHSGVAKIEKEVFALAYCVDIDGNDVDMRQVLLDDPDAHLAYQYCYLSKKDDDEMRQHIIQVGIERNNANYIYLYGLNVKDSDDIKNAIIDSGDVDTAYFYYKKVNDSPDVLNMLINSGKPDIAVKLCDDGHKEPLIRNIILNGDDAYSKFLYCRDISDDSDMFESLLATGDISILSYYTLNIRFDPRAVQVIADHGDDIQALNVLLFLNENPHPTLPANITNKLRQKVLSGANGEMALMYFKEIANDEDMLEAVVRLNNPKTAYALCKHLHDHGKAGVYEKEYHIARQTIILSKNAEWAYGYCRDVSNDDEMRQVVIDAKNPEWAYYYCLSVENNDAMRQVIIDSKNPIWAQNYDRHVKPDSEMRQVILDSKKCYNGTIA